jgi:hypothetical protein
MKVPMKHSLAVLLFTFSSLTRCALPAAEPAATHPAVAADYSNPRATARSFVLAIKAWDMDALMACCDIPKGASADFKSHFGRDLAIRHLGAAAISKWGKDAFGGDDKLSKGTLGLSDELLDHWLEVIDQSALYSWNNGNVSLKFVLKNVREPDWHGPVTIILYSPMKKVGQSWKFDLDEPVGADEPATDKERREAMYSIWRTWAEAVNHLSEDVEQGRIKTVEELNKSLDDVNAKYDLNPPSATK